MQPPLYVNFVSIGGGTGLSSLLSGLKAFVADGKSEESDQSTLIKMLTAVVTVTDDGGSSGRLREEFHILPPGDIRNCLVALSEDEKLLAKLFQYRFSGNGELHGHSFGNLFLTALTGVTGDFLEAIKLSSEVLAIRGRIFPSTVTDVALIAELENGQIVSGETNISRSRSRIKRIRLSPEHCLPLEETLRAIESADMITLGPGSLYTSIIPNLLVEGIPEAISRSKATKVYISNIMTQPGETDGFTVQAHVEALLAAAPQLKLDYIAINSGAISQSQKASYASEGAIQIGLEELEQPFITSSGSTVSLVTGDFLDESEKVRHSPRKLAEALLKLCAAKN
ncbi:MAG: YvcK family protein [Blastocatellia bacterium]|nr:YvcK family protein [Blastocatellia bacterium]